MESRGVVHEIIERKGALLLCFLNHDGVFRLPAGNDVLYARATESRDKKIEIHFTYDAKLTILDIY